MTLFKKSLRTSVAVRGYTLQRLPLESYLSAVERLKDLPGGLLEACFPGMTLSGILNDLKQIDEKTLTRLAGSAFTVAPQYIIRLIAELTNIPEEQLWKDQQIGLDGLAEIVEAFWQLNGLGNFTAAIRRLKDPVTQSIGSKT